VVVVLVVVAVVVVVVVVVVAPLHYNEVAFLGAWSMCKYLSALPCALHVDAFGRSGDCTNLASI